MLSVGDKPFDTLQTQDGIFMLKTELTIIMPKIYIVTRTKCINYLHSLNFKVCII